MVRQSKNVITSRYYEEHLIEILGYGEEQITSQKMGKTCEAVRAGILFIVKMKKILFLTVFSFVSVLCFSQDMKGKWTAEFNLNLGKEFNNYSPATGLDFGTGVNYHILNRLGVSTQLHSFQQMFRWEETKSYHIGDPMTLEDYQKAHHNLSYMLWNINAFGDIFVTKKNNRLRLQIGATYMRGANVVVSAWSAYYVEEIGNPLPPDKINGTIASIGYDNINTSV